MSLSSLYTELHSNAARTGEDRATTLKGGARIAVRVAGDVTTLTISRKGKRLGDVEIVTFKRECNVPSDAIRFPRSEQGQRTVDGVVHFYIAFRWRDGAAGDGASSVTDA
jgi:hypothetical protein